MINVGKLANPIVKTNIKLLINHSHRLTRINHYSSSADPPLKIVNCNSSSIEVEFDNGDSVKFNNLFLRDACDSPLSVDPYSKQKTFSTGGLEQYCKPNSVPIVVTDSKGGYSMNVEWFDPKGASPHKSSYSANFLKTYATPEGRRRGKYFDTKQTVWNQDTIDTEKITFKYDDYINDDMVFYEMLKNMNKYGLAFIKDIPMEDTTTNNWRVETIANRIGYIRETFYGKLFDVKSIPKAKNIAYTDVYLPLHMDLLYYESPPGLQLLHSIKNSANGGENIFVDSFNAAQFISETDQPAYLALKTVHIPYHYENDDEFYYFTRPLIVEDETYTNLNGKQSIKEVNYSPPFQAPFDSNEIVMQTNSYLMNDFLRGLKLFEKFIYDERNQLILKMPENTCVVFDNRRLLHSRNAFQFTDKSQERWLKGCYIDTDTYLSRLRVYYSKFNS